MHCNAREGRAASWRALIYPSSDHYGARPRTDGRRRSTRLDCESRTISTREIAESAAFGGRRCPRVEREGQRGRRKERLRRRWRCSGMRKVNFRSMPSVSDVQVPGISRFVSYRAHARGFARGLVTPEADGFRPKAVIQRFSKCCRMARPHAPAIIGPMTQEGRCVDVDQ